MPPGDDFDALAKDEKTKQALQRALRQLSEAKASKAELVEAVYRAATDCFEGLELKPVEPPKKRKEKDGGVEVAVSSLGDLQLGKVTPTYNSKVCEQRIGILADKVRRLVDIQRSDHPVNEARVWMLGDIIEGMDIFPGQQWLVDSSLYRQIALDGPRILGNYLRALLSHFDRVHVTAVIGNHGRIGRHGVYDPETNGDRMVYTITRQLLEGEKRLTWNIPDGMGERHWYAVDTIGDYSCVLFHGDQFGGKFQGTLTRVGVQRKVAGWRAGAIPEPFKDVEFGHWHQNYEDNVCDVNVRCNGSPESTNTFAQERLAALSRPFQRLKFVHPENGEVTAEYKVRLA